jgi:hypothetical protein
MKIHERASKLRKKWTTGQTDIYGNLDYQPHEIIRRAFYMLNFTHLNGEKDENGRLKPYMDLYQRVMDTQLAGEDLDTKDFDFEAIKPQFLTQSFLLEKEHQDWIREVNWGETINEFTATRGIFGYAWLKPIRANGKLDFEVVNWATINPDPDDFDGDKYEEHIYNKSQLFDMKQRGWDNDEIERLLSREEDEFIVHEWHGIASLADYKDFKGKEVEDGDEFKFKDYVFIYALVDTTDEGGKKKKEAVNLFGEEETKNAYYGLKYGKNPRGELGVGSAEKTFQPQQWQNYLAKQEKDVQDLAGKVIVQSPKGNKMKGKNITKLKNGTILEYTDGKNLSRLDLSPSAMANFTNLGEKWRRTSDESNSVYASNTGSDLPSNQTLRGLVLQAEQANNPFAQRREEMDLFMRELYDEEVIPYLIKRIRNKKEVSGEFTVEELSKLDGEVSEYFASKKVIRKLLNGKYDDLPLEEKWSLIAEEKARTMAEVQEKLQRTKNKRYFGGEGFNEMFKDFHKKVRLIITDEQRNKRAFLSNISEVLTLMANPQIQQNKQAKHLLDQMLEAVNMNPISIPDNKPPQGQEITPMQNLQAPQLEANQVTPE